MVEVDRINDIKVDISVPCREYYTLVYSPGSKVEEMEVARTVQNMIRDNRISDLEDYLLNIGAEREYYETDDWRYSDAAASLASSHVPRQNKQRQARLTGRSNYG